MKAYTTPEVAKLADIHLRTLHRWLERGAIPEPKAGSLGGLKVRLWSESDVRRVKRYRQKFWAKGRGRKKKTS
jgi:excisionase family DNA binding protein